MTCAPAAPSRVPAYAAGPGAPDTALSLLAEAGWTAYQDENANTTLVSPDGQVRAEFGPETGRYHHNRHAALWQVTYTDANPYSTHTWTALFGDRVPAEAIAAFFRTLIHPDGLDPDRD
jgi:hypothetical protein